MAGEFSARPGRRWYAVVTGASVVAVALQCVRATEWVAGGGNTSEAVVGALVSLVVVASVLAQVGWRSARSEHLAVVALGATTVGFPWLSLRASGIGGTLAIAVVFIGIAAVCLSDRRLAGRRPLLVVGILVAALGVGVALVQPGRWPVEIAAESAAQAAGEVLMGTALRLPAAWVCAALLGLGVVRVLVLRRSSARSGAIALGALVLGGALYVGASSPGLPVLGADAYPAFPAPEALAAVLAVPWVLVSVQGGLLLAEEITRARTARVRVASTTLVLLVFVALGARGLVNAVLGGAGI